ncbi:hypothetical protein DPEC_G00326470 [Dallia pectoralis]|uniref:Uncharacterized protein n=1 Tax=Dallia pectoralis TaxID=75939 RepID=A0ACC2F813_DALPE|nr:hypothetical protein DPEC_G00326470 [Dallia pectoralis]
MSHGGRIFFARHFFRPIHYWLPGFPAFVSNRLDSSGDRTNLAEFSVSGFRMSREESGDASLNAHWRYRGLAPLQPRVALLHVGLCSRHLGGGACVCARVRQHRDTRGGIAERKR